MKKRCQTIPYFLMGLLFLGFMPLAGLFSQEVQDSSLLTIDRIFNSSEFRMERFGPVRWTDDGAAYTMVERSSSGIRGQDIVRYNTQGGEKEILVAADKLVPAGDDKPLTIADYFWSNDKHKLLIFTNTQKVWRLHTRGDYWVLDLLSWDLEKLGGDLPESSLMFAKFSPDDSRVAYVSDHNLYVESLGDHYITQLTGDGAVTLINGTFDWAYEEEFSCRDGFSWSPDGNNIAYWQLDASGIRDFLLINNTDSIYSYVIPVQYPKVGYLPSGCRIGVIPSSGGRTTWMEIPGDLREHYLPRMMWDPNGRHLLVQQLNYRQDTLWLWHCNAATGEVVNIYTESDPAWIDVVDEWQWLDGGKAFLWVSEKDGWRHYYRIATDGFTEKLLTPGFYDVISLEKIDMKNDMCYFTASPDNPTQRYLYRLPLNGEGTLEMITPADVKGTHSYDIAPGCAFAFHHFSSLTSPPLTELVALPGHELIRVVNDNASFLKAYDKLRHSHNELFRVTTADGIQMDGWMMKPPDFDPSRKYPVLFYVYGEPAGQTATDSWPRNLWYLMLAQKGYIVMTLDNRGTPCPKGREWRKSIYRRVGVLNSHDQAMAAKEILKWDFVDPDRIAVWGWSGGGSMTLNLMFRYPEIYKTGLAVAAVSDERYYNTIYQQRYMGLLAENPEDYIEGSPITFAKDLQGNLLFVHGTGDDNVHYQNAEALINELIKYNKQFTFMPYPSRTHGIYEGENTTRHLFTLLTNYLMEHAPPGAR
jgi:dipeptidyl-peptidase-4